MLTGIKKHPQTRPIQTITAQGATTIPTQVQLVLNRQRIKGHSQFRLVQEVGLITLIATVTKPTSKTINQQLKLKKVQSLVPFFLLTIFSK